MASTRGRQVVIPLANKTGGAVALGDVVVMDASNDTAFTTTTTGRYEGVVGIAQEAIANNATGRVLIQGYAGLVNVPASVTRGHYIETHTVAKQATGSATRRSGSLGVFLTGGTTPTAVLGGLPDQTASGGATGALVFLEAHTASASATLDFTSFISSTYDTYIFKLVSILPATSTAKLYMRVGTGGGPTYDAAANYGWQLQRNNFNSAAQSGLDSAANQIELTVPWLSTGAHGISGSLELYDPQSTALQKFVGGMLIYPNSTLGNMVWSVVGGQWTTAITAVTAVRFLMSSGNITSGVIRAYGVAKS